MLIRINASAIAKQTHTLLPCENTSCWTVCSTFKLPCLVFVSPLIFIVILCVTGRTVVNLLDFWTVFVFCLCPAPCLHHSASPPDTLRMNSCGFMDVVYRLVSVKDCWELFHRLLSEWVVIKNACFSNFFIVPHNLCCLQVSSSFIEETIKAGPLL